MSHQIGANIIIDRQLRQYRNDLQAWVARIQREQRIETALMSATHRPQLGSLARSLTGTVSSDKKRAENEVEQILLKLADDLDPADKNIVRYMRMAQGHWPRLWQNLNQKLQAQKNS